MRCRQVELEIAARQQQTADWLRRIERLEKLQQLKYPAEPKVSSLEPVRKKLVSEIPNSLCILLLAPDLPRP